MTSDDSSGTVDPGKVHTSLPDDTADAALVPDNQGGEAVTEIWGPRVFHPHLLGPDDERDGGARAWVLRVLITAYFLEHDNEPAPAQEILEWVQAMTPRQVYEAIGVAVGVGLP